MNIADVVSGRAKWRGIQWVLFSATACKVLADQLRALLPARALVGPLHPREVRFKPGRELTAYYDAHIYSEGRKRSEERRVGKECKDGGWGEHERKKKNRYGQSGLLKHNADIHLQIQGL